MKSKKLVLVIDEISQALGEDCLKSIITKNVENQN
jgi:hypothetical protein